MAILSFFFQQDCIEKGRLVDPNAHPLYRPMKASLESHIFEGCIIALSSMERLEKEAYTELLKTFGAMLVIFIYFHLPVFSLFFKFLIWIASLSSFFFFNIC